MNDFTKEELEMLLNSLEHALFSKYYHPEMTGLRKKIHAMIFNYCDHEFYVNGCGENAFGQCHKCGEIRRLIKNE